MKTLERIPNAIGIPPVTGTRSIYTRTPADKEDEGYKADCEFFRTHPKRNHAIRAFISEFQEVIVSVSENPAPLLHIYVIQIAPGYLVQLPIWRGPAEWRVEACGAGTYASVAGDEAIHSILDNCRQYGGMNPAALMEYREHMRVANEAGKLMANEPNDKKVN